ncbi:MAG: hypothetical protein RIQ79_2457, partial [Verrucomicrobiota bacterium]
MSAPVIEIHNLGKSYRLWRDPSSRLKAPLWEAVGGLVPKRLRPVALQKRLNHESGSPYYRDFHALTDISFSLNRGESVGIMGTNGSGKSTLLQIIAGTLQPTSGTARTRGMIAALLELGSGFNPDFTGRENVFLNASVLGLKVEEIEAKFDEIASFADIGNFIDQPVKTYSSGMLMRLAFSVQVAVVPEILIIDEALSVGDVFFTQKCFAKIREIQERGTSLLFVSHDTAAIQ